MPFYDRQYDLYVMLGNPAADPAWVEPVWKIISSAIDPLIQSARGQAAVRSTQLKPGPGSPNKRAISFGRIAWNEHGQEKWIHPANGDDIRFVSAEVWAPSWTICGREGRAPDTYFAVRNEKSKPQQHVCFNPIVLLAVALDQDGHLLEQGRKSAETIAQTLLSVSAGTMQATLGLSLRGNIFKRYRRLDRKRPIQARPPASGGCIHVDFKWLVGGILTAPICLEHIFTSIWLEH